MKRIANRVRVSSAIRTRTRWYGRPGFTLVEMLVVVALTLIMMVCFAQIFQATADFTTKQKGIAENDQTARILTTVMKGDLQNRTMILVAPFHPNMPPLGDDDQNRQGYFYYSENNPLDDTDDVLQFTVKIPTTNSQTQNLNPPFYGRATFLPAPWQGGINYPPGSLVRPSSNTTTYGFVFKNKGGAFTSGGGEPNWSTATAAGQTVSDGTGQWTALLSPIDQPDADDGIIAYNSLGQRTINPNGNNPNNTGASQYAEVSYFLRHGNLYRRVLLIRQPYDTMSNPDSQPYDTDTPPALLIPGPGYTPTPGTNGSFWGDFDYSARFDIANGRVQFHTVGTSNDLSNLVPGTTFPLGRPDNRFGHDQTDGTSTRNGAPREFDSNSTMTINNGLPQFFGRYTHEETSNVNFGFPGFIPPAGSPMGSATVLALDPQKFTMSIGNPAVPLDGGPRRGEEILATNVLRFDVKIWDNRYSEVALAQDVNRNGIIDSSAAFADVGHAASGDFASAANVFPAYTSSSTAANSQNIFDTWYRQFDFDNADGDGLHTTGCDPAPYRPRVGTTWQAGHAYNVGDQVDPTNTSNGYFYTAKTVTGPSGPTDPFNPTDIVGNTVTDGGVTWTVNPPLALQAIQITVQYLDPTQNLLRQVTIVQQLTK